MCFNRVGFSAFQSGADIVCVNVLALNDRLRGHADRFAEPQYRLAFCDGCNGKFVKRWNVRDQFKGGIADADGFTRPHGAQAYSNIVLR